MKYLFIFLIFFEYLFAEEVSDIGKQNSQYRIIIKISEQKLYLYQNGKCIKTYPVSTSKYGIGNKMGSNKTPIGLHRIKEKIGDNVKEGTVFKHGKVTKQVVKIYKDQTDLDEDLVITRVIKLEGLEKGKNKNSDVDTEKRKIYIHGTPEEGLIGKPSSHGCIRMKNKDIIELYKIVPVGTLVEIQE
jgi:lipoprotein-anchoring transpeptidase ErfK/SrfK